jgi:hypothetical protein
MHEVKPIALCHQEPFELKDGGPVRVSLVLSHDIGCYNALHLPPFTEYGTLDFKNGFC